MIIKINYRPEIDGLRAVAVLSVIFYHAQIFVQEVQILKGGFIGVDIFFVISGYLITSLIIKELIQNGKIDFIYFYQRRIRRIIPALLIVIIFTIPFAWIYLLPSDFIDFTKSIIYSLGFSSNYYFHFLGQEYGAKDGLVIPLLHTWSLSVEEQYYILAPICILLIFNYFKKKLEIILILMFVLSLILSTWASNNYPSLSFYSLFTRLWEIIFGSLIAWREFNSKHFFKMNKYQKLLPTTGSILILYALFFFDDNTLHPSIYTLLPILGVSCIICFAEKNEIITKILSSKLFVAIGLISYSLYLWHYPIFSFARIAEFTEGIYLRKIYIALIILILSILTYFFIERPFRNKKIISNKILITSIFSSILILIFFSFFVIKKNGIESRFPKMFVKKLKADYDKIEYYNKGTSGNVVLVGDSHADAIGYKLNEKLKDNDYSLYRFKTSFYLNNFNFIDIKTKKIIKEFKEQNKEIDNFLNTNKDLIVVYHLRWSLRFLETNFDGEEGYKEFTNEEDKYFNYLEPIGIKNSNRQERLVYLEKGIKRQINEIIKKKHKLILVYPVPEMGFYPPSLLWSKYKKNKFKDSKIDILSTSYEVYKKRHSEIFRILDSIKDENIYRVFPHKFFCNAIIEGRCVANDLNDLYYYDLDHVSLKGSKLIVDDIWKVIQNIK